VTLKFWPYLHNWCFGLQLTLNWKNENLIAGGSVAIPFPWLLIKRVARLAVLGVRL